MATTALVSNVSASSGKSYSLASMAAGTKMYTDRTYQITSVPTVLSGASLIQTANDDKWSTSTSLLSFDLSQPAIVYVAYDPRATALPGWLSGWQKLADRVGVDDSKISSMVLYSKSFPAGRVTLGGNMASPAAGAETGFLVVARSSGTNESTTALVTDVVASTGKSYSVADLAAGIKMYVDRTYQITSVPTALSGSSLIQTANGDKWNTSSSYLTFSLSQNATVYVAYDPRATALPSWLSGWTKLADRLGVDDSNISSMVLYSKSFAAGKVTLGGNMVSPAAGAENNYLVIAKQSDGGTQTPGMQNIQVNFQLAGSSTPSGYVADAGLAYDASRGYGWINPSTGQPKDQSASMRERSGSADLRLRTLAQMQASTGGQTPGNWELAVPNGIYNVTVSVGDPSYYDSRHQINVEGVSAIAGFVPTSQVWSKSANVNVEVKDGKLTIDASGGSNTKLNYVLVSPASAEGDIIAPVANVSFNGTMQSEGVYRNEVQITVDASDNGGSGLASVQYSLNGGAYAAYTSPLKLTTVGNYTFRAKATDGSGNTTTTDLYSFSIAKSTATNTYMVVENQDKLPALDEMTFSLIQIPWRRLKSDGTYTSYNANHNQVKLRISNKGKGTLIVNELMLSNTTDWQIAQLNGAAYSAGSSLPVSVGPGSYVDALIEYRAKDKATRVKVQHDTLFIRSNDDFVPYKKVALHGLWQKQGEDVHEPWAQEIISAFGFRTKTGYNHDDGAIDGNSVVPNSDEIAASFFVRADPSRPISVTQMAAYHNCCSSTEKIQWYSQGSTTINTLFTHNPVDGQSLLPRKSGSSTALAQANFSTSSTFAFKVGSDYTDRTRNSEGKIGIRVWKVIDSKGNVVPNAYIIGNDYLGTQYTNYDYNDNLYYISNVKPASGSANYSELVAAPSDVSFGTLQTGASKTLSVTLKNAGQTYASGNDPAVQISKVELVGPNFDEFSYTLPATTSLGAQGTTSMSAKFNPKSPGLKNAALLVYYNSGGSPLRIPLYGIANSSSTTISLVKRIKGAADANVSIGGNTWEADANYRSGSIKLDAQMVKTPIAATDDDVLYQTYLSAATDMAETGYNIPLANGNYVVRLHFVENYFSAIGSRVFNTIIENSLRLANFDIYREVGYRSALVKDIEVSVTDGVLNFKFDPTANRVAIAGLEIYKVTTSAGVVAATASQSKIADGTHAVESRNLRLYPNPVTGNKVTMELNGFGAKEQVTVTMHDMSGRLVQTSVVQTNELGAAVVEVPVSRSTSRGIYVLKAVAPSGQAQSKLVVH
ncbi:malectin domain-containing carbohydrate-binding protein [Pontibacter chitinilyticus]|uniref:malectin domain-containing carbohydrate-binding protein n=1 Tax=Pontibacter chitinilyticus TaxID=2674989 RepID=UPI00321A6B43